MSKKRELSSDRAVRKAGACPAPEPPSPSQSNGMTESATVAKPVWKFWNKSRCPRCNGLETKAYASSDGIQLRVCEVPICGWRYKVVGEIA